MLFKTKRTLENKVFTTVVKFDSYGSPAMDAAEEEALITDFGAPQIDLGAIVFSDKFIVGTDKRVIADPTGEVVSFIVDSKKIGAAAGFEATYSIDSKKNTGAVGTILKSQELIAEAKCVLFENKVKEAIELAVAALKAKRTTFESGSIEFKA